MMALEKIQTQRKAVFFKFGEWGPAFWKRPKLPGQLCLSGAVLGSHFEPCCGQWDQALRKRTPKTGQLCLSGAVLGSYFEKHWGQRDLAFWKRPKLPGQLGLLGSPLRNQFGSSGDGHLLGGMGKVTSMNAFAGFIQPQ